MKKFSILVVVLLFLAIVTNAQGKLYNTLIKGGRVIDAKNNINALMDVAIKDGKIAKVAQNIDVAQAEQVVNAKGMYVTPGLIDVHAHVFWGTQPNSYLSNGDVGVTADGFSFRSGVTTLVDCGGPGYKSFDTFKKNIIDKSQTRILAFLNIVGEGMRGGDYEQDVSDMDVNLAAKAALDNKEHVVGFKLAHFTNPDWTPVERIVVAGKLANMPVIIDFGGGKLPIEDLFFKYLRPGDIYTHVFTELERRDPIVNLQTRQLRPFVIPAQKRGIIFDVGFGGGSFNFNQAIPAIKAGFLPDLMGTDLHTGSMNGSMKDQLNVLSIHLAMGMNLQSVIERSTWRPAQAIKRTELGHLSEGAIADIAILSMRQGKFGFRDIAMNRQEGTQKLECEMTIKGGRIMYDLNAIASNVKK
ncbi:MAG: dihydroorotase [Sphingobacteriales bacterium 17-39-43]|uniref:amidohydrolase/deacetylase family metallohydrolase n=1 Tax=Daejeonella sp. TaxID=2805397 RepID=UPI000BC658D2|nr:amidohydrolase/deacetylase family metallohydrolase [Daejeonella sp.]OYZ32768.1 MAG: dihydroorotase [Sphingobacteriales bacterium 16-39-50]OZA26179.1 MAG: dihydroorotase [Sphingobacteriales bacterium 17-39-43]HQT23114.1 amidohydrolase/deacetylase family metallohydrolase [Daejeonella sp.]HQT56025.1 amidohydrolase/deacetylase family metallohydrolase [Daejeonella sp.]